MYYKKYIMVNTIYFITYTYTILYFVVYLYIFYCIDYTIVHFMVYDMSVKLKAESGPVPRFMWPTGA